MVAKSLCLTVSIKSNHLSLRQVSNSEYIKSGKDVCYHQVFDDGCTSGCVVESKEDTAFHGILRKIASEEFMTSVSLYDIPKLYEKQIPHASRNYYNYPVHTLCQEESKTQLHVANWYSLKDFFQGNCSILWKEYTSAESGDLNPYEIDEGNELYTCALGLGNSAR